MCCAEFELDEEVQLQIMNGTDKESRTIRHMVIPFGEGTFTCRHWNSETKLCEIYEDRPDMCRDFPSEDGCGVAGCGFYKEEE